MFCLRQTLQRWANNFTLSYDTLFNRYSFNVPTLNIFC
jgi:hypothetical protein